MSHCQKKVEAQRCSWESTDLVQNILIVCWNVEAGEKKSAYELCFGDTIDFSMLSSV